MKTKDNMILAPGNRVTLFYIDEHTEVKRLDALIGANGDTGCGPSGVPLAVNQCYGHKFMALEEAIRQLDNTITHLRHRCDAVREQLKAEVKTLEGRP